MFVSKSKVIFMDDTDVVYVAIGGMCLSLVLAFLIASMGSQTFYPREGAVGMWCAIGLMLRVDQLRALAIQHSHPEHLSTDGETLRSASPTYTRTG